MSFKDGDRIVFIGDSVTDCGRREEHAPYGDGYVNLIRSLVTAMQPQLSLQWVNAGVSGDTVRHLQRRWDTDAVDAQPDWLSVMIGINDVWRMFDGRPDEAVPAAEYAHTLHELLVKAHKEAGCRLIVAGPYLVEPDPADPHRQASQDHAAIARDIARAAGALFVDTQAAFDRVLAHHPPGMFAPDRIHPTMAGHAVIATAYVQTIGVEAPCL